MPVIFRPVVWRKLLFLRFRQLRSRFLNQAMMNSLRETKEQINPGLRRRELRRKRVTQLQRDYIRYCLRLLRYAQKTRRWLPGLSRNMARDDACKPFPSFKSGDGGHRFEFGTLPTTVVEVQTLLKGVRYQLRKAEARNKQAVTVLRQHFGVSAVERVKEFCVGPLLRPLLVANLPQIDWAHVASLTRSNHLNVLETNAVATYVVVARLRRRLSQLGNVSVYFSNSDDNLAMKSSMLSTRHSAKHFRGLNPTSDRPGSEVPEPLMLRVERGFSRQALEALFCRAIGTV